MFSFIRHIGRIILTIYFCLIRKEASITDRFKFLKSDIIKLIPECSIVHFTLFKTTFSLIFISYAVL